MQTARRDASTWIVNGRSLNRPWVIVAFIAAIAVAVVVFNQRFMAYETITYEVRTCQEPLTGESSWTDVVSADCAPVSDTGPSVVLYEGSSRHEPAAVGAGRFSFESFPLNSTLHSVEFTAAQPVGTVLIVEPTTERVRRVMTGDAAGTSWSGFVGGRGPTEYWLLVTP